MPDLTSLYSDPIRKGAIPVGPRPVVLQAWDCPLFGSSLNSLTALRRPIFTTRPAQRHAPAVERLAEMLAIRRQLSAEKVAPENASRLLENPMLQRLSRRRIARLTADIDTLDKHLVEIVASDAASAKRADVPFARVLRDLLEDQLDSQVRCVRHRQAAIHGAEQRGPRSQGKACARDGRCFAGPR